MMGSSVAFSAPEGSYFFIMELNVPTTTTIQPPNSNPTTPINNNSTTTTTTTTNNPLPLPPPPSSCITIPQNPIVQIPTVPGIPANADITNNLVAPPQYPCSLTTIIINFPPVPPPNPFPHPGFLTSASKYTRSKDSTTSNADPSISDSNPAEQTDSATSSTEDSSPHQITSTSNNTTIPPDNKNVPSRRPSLSAPRPRGLNLTTTLSSLSSSSRISGAANLTSSSTQLHSNPISSRPRAAFKGSTSTFIKSSDGLPMSQSLIRTFYSSSSSSSSDSSPSNPMMMMTREQEGEERTFGFYTWNKSVTFVQLSPSRPTGETLFKLSFATFPTYVSINPYTASSTIMDVMIGFSTGDLIYFDPFCARYTRLNKGGCISGSAVSKVVWLSPWNNNKLHGHFVSSHQDGTLIYWDKDRDDYNNTFIVDPWPKSTPHPTLNNSNIPTLSSSSNTTTTTTTDHQHEQNSSRKKSLVNGARTCTFEMDPRAHDIQISSLYPGLPPEKRNRLNPLSHWRISKKSITDFAFSPDFKLCAVVSQDGCLRIIDTETNHLLDTYFSYFGALLCVCWSSDGRLVFTGGQDDLVTVYSPIEQKVIARCQGHSSFVTGLSFDPWFSHDRSSRFASISEDCKLIFWDLSGASLAKPRTQQQINNNNNNNNNSNSNNTQHQQGTTNNRRPSSNSMTTSPILNFQHNNNNNKSGINLNTSRQELSSITPTTNDLMVKSPGIHPAPGRNEVAILQPVMVKEVGIDPLSSICFHRDSIVISSRTGQIFMFGRPIPPRSINYNNNNNKNNVIVNNSGGGGNSGVTT